MAKNKQSTFADILADSGPSQGVVKVGKHSVTVQELSGPARFELGERQEVDRWESTLWMCMQGIVEPKPKNEKELLKLGPRAVVKIATEVMRLSGLDEDSAEDAKNE